MNYFQTLLKDRNNCYEINLELEVRKLFEKNTSYLYEFQKNNDIYGYDIKVFKYNIDKGNWNKNHIYNIEVEVSEKWQNEYPKNWKSYSFLSRKVFTYDFENKQYKNELKPFAEKTSYIIFNKCFNDSFCQTINYISSLDKIELNVTGDNRKDTFLRAKLTDTNIKRGVTDCLNFIYTQIKNSEKN